MIYCEIFYWLNRFSGERDYIHIMDLARGHVQAIKKLQDVDGLGFKAYNLGTGNGYTVLQVLQAYKEVFIIATFCA